MAVSIRTLEETLPCDIDATFTPFQIQVRDYFEYSEPWLRRSTAQTLIWREVASRVPAIRLRMARKRREAPREQPATMDVQKPERDFRLQGNFSNT